MAVPYTREQAELVRTAEELAEIARVVTLAHFRSADLTAQNKAATHFDPVTFADREAERQMRAYLARHRPQDGILGEELGAHTGESGLTWVLDPIDGTRGFLSGTPTWGVLIAASAATGPVLGVIDQPYIGERFLGGFGQAWLAGPRGRRSLSCRAARPLDQAILFSTFPEIGTPEEGAAFARLSARVRLTRYGMDCYAYALVAMGQVDLVVEAGLKPYDIQAPLALIEAAGGVVSDWHGGPAHQGGRVIAAANAEIHAEAVAVLTEAP